VYLVYIPQMTAIKIKHKLLIFRYQFNPSNYCVRYRMAQNKCRKIDKSDKLCFIHSNNYYYINYYIMDNITSEKSNDLLDSIP
jgi:hypothetical protein